MGLLPTREAMFAVVTSKVDNHATVPRVTTIGGGHGQAVILQALRDLRATPETPPHPTLSDLHNLAATGLRLPRRVY